MSVAALEVVAEWKSAPPAWAPELELGWKRQRAVAGGHKAGWFGATALKAALAGAGSAVV